MPTVVDRCECSGKSFSEMLAIARANDIKTVKSLRKLVGGGRYCSACAPFVHEALKTGYTEFELIED